MEQQYDRMEDQKPRPGLLHEKDVAKGGGLEQKVMFSR